jgi:hypothetical protein
MLCVVGAALFVGTVAQAEVVIDTVSVGNPGNDGELSGECVPPGYGPCRICGAVLYTYRIGKYEITAGQYAEFLNAVATTDTYGLYNASMNSDPKSVFKKGTSRIAETSGHEIYHGNVDQ